MDDNALMIALAFVVIGLPVILGVGSNVFKTWIRHREAMMGALNAQAAERAGQYAAQTERLEDACACWNGSSPIAASRSTPRSIGCASTRRHAERTETLP